MIENSKKLCQILHQMDGNNSIMNINTGETHSSDDAFINMDTDTLETKFVQKENKLYLVDSKEPVFEIISDN